MFYNLPNILTISRIIVIPVIFLSIYIETTAWSILTAVLFVLASITDYLDGYLARARNQNSVLGRLLDPIADKLLVVSALLILVANKMVNDITLIPVIIIMCREVLVSGLREFLAEFQVGMPVTRLAKWKTGFQMTAISMILFQKLPYIGDYVNSLGEFLLWVAGVLTFITGYIYFDKCLKYIYSIEKKNPIKSVEKKVKNIAAKVKKKVSKTVAEKGKKRAYTRRTPEERAAAKKAAEEKAAARLKAKSAKAKKAEEEKKAKEKATEEKVVVKKLTEKKVAAPKVTVADGKPEVKRKRGRPAKVRVVATQVEMPLEDTMKKISE